MFFIGSIESEIFQADRRAARNAQSADNRALLAQKFYIDAYGHETFVKAAEKQDTVPVRAVFQRAVER